MASKKRISPAEAGIIGAAAGIAVGATAVALSSKKNRQKIADGFIKVKEMGQEAYDDIKKKMAVDMAPQGRKKAKAIKKTVKG